jgi:hypothetical protein
LLFWVARGALGFLAGVISVLAIHQPAWAALHVSGIVAGLSEPYAHGKIANLCLIGGLFGIPIGLGAKWLRWPQLWIWGSILGFGSSLLAVAFAPGALHFLFGNWLPVTPVGLVLVNGLWGCGAGLLVYPIEAVTKRLTAELLAAGAGGSTPMASWLRRPRPQPGSAYGGGPF